ncbi:MAG: NAD(P)H-dependent oxidoreductase subunit E [Candidatus Riflebacteria bacterium]|nr:NAD(P)H-dependent oxidoreductase subunit E [Candidatus Riflebacteria bacterium]
MNKIEKIDEIICRNEGSRFAVLKSFHEVQEFLGYIPEPVLSMICEKYNISKPQLKTDMSFYSYFSSRPKAKNIIRCCTGLSCSMKDAEDIFEYAVKKIGTPEKSVVWAGNLSAEKVCCLGKCHEGPSIELNGKIITGIDKRKLEIILSQYSNVRKR